MISDSVPSIRIRGTKTILPADSDRLLTILTALWTGYGSSCSGCGLGVSAGPGPGPRVPQMILTLGTRNPSLSWENKSAHGEAACI